MSDKVWIGMLVFTYITAAVLHYYLGKAVQRDETHKEGRSNG